MSPTYYYVMGTRDESLCILPEGQIWKVFLSERGKRDEEKAFDSEDAACVYFLKRIFELWSA